jgi:type IV pilus assembly protein PilW
MERRGLGVSKKIENRIIGMRPSRSSQGFTLLELLMAMAISVAVMAAIYSTFFSQQQSYMVQDQVAAMQQNLRSGMFYMEREIRMAGYDPEDSGNFGITDVQWDSVVGTWRIQFQADLNENKTLDVNETVTYSMFDDDGDGISDDFGRTEGAAATQLLAENIDYLSFAYAFDNDGDGELDYVDANANGVRDANEPIIWAIDDSGDGLLDLNLDSNGDGVIDESDDGDSDGLIDGQVLATAIPPAAIRAVQIWLLARSSSPMRGYTDTNTYVVGDMLRDPNNRFRHKLLTTQITMRNLFGS